MTKEEKLKALKVLDDFLFEDDEKIDKSYYQLTTDNV